MLIVFIFSIVAAFTLIARKLNIAIALGLALLIYTIPFLRLDIIRILVEVLFSKTLLQTITSLVLAMFLADLYRLTHVADKVVSSLESLNPRVAAISIPAIIGLLPMPAGAYISASVINPLYTKCRLDPHEKTFLNYWFRHIWVTIWPLYQSVILASAILNTSFNTIIFHNWPIFVAAIVGGAITSRSILYRINSNCIGYRDKCLRDLMHLWPFIAIVVMVMVLKLPLPLTLAITIILFIAVYRPSINIIRDSVRYSFDITIIVLVIESLIFSRVIIDTGLSYQLAEYLVSYVDISVFMIPLLMVITTGFEFTFVAIAFPSLQPLLNSYRVTLAFMGGYIGAMLSPVHACLILSAKFFKSNLKDVYSRYLILTAILTILIVIAILIANNIVYS